MKDRIILADGTVIELEAGASLSSLQVVSENKDKMLETWDKFTDENLKSVQVQNGAGLVVANYTNLLLVSETSVVNVDGTVKTKFNLREKTQEELDIEELKNDMQALNNAIGGAE